jgi:hypothetical protein
MDKIAVPCAGHYLLPVGFAAPDNVEIRMTGLSDSQYWFQ